MNGLKFLNDDTLDILAVPFSGPIGGRDTDGEYFSKRTNLCLDWFPETRPLLYDHGFDGMIQTDAIGHLDSKSIEKRDDGWWVRAQLDRKSKYLAQIRQLIDADSLYASSSAMPHHVVKMRDGEIVRWPWVELSLTPTPANMFARVTAATVAKHYKNAGLLSDLLAVRIAQMNDDGLPALLEEWIAGTDTAAKVGRVLSAANEKKIRDALVGLQAVIDALGS